MEESTELAGMALSHPSRPPLSFFLLKSLGLTQLIKAEGKYQKALSVLTARIGEMSPMNCGKSKTKNQNQAKNPRNSG